MDFRGDAPPTAMDPYRDNVISAKQQSILNELRIDLCHEDLAYLNDHKEVEAIATLVIKDILRNTPQDPRAHAARFLKDSRTAERVANFSRFEDNTEHDLLDRDVRIYSTMAMALDEHNAWPDYDQGRRAHNLYKEIFTNEPPPNNL
ncbi:Hypothetical protein CINCED_3A013432 [Cinara cedri]|uniref:Uncharacterized protein n=1 Tax=Cinara cedri TaxID=506608 RepID=A0A5E4M0L1_9HEMI|nr:Hypothetical protein CINCED_3A013432 [Cinara cedri]